MRVLLVEDDARLSADMERRLQTEGFNVYATDSGEEAIDLAKLYDYDAILLDLGLPDVSGLEVLRKVRLAKVTTPILVVTGVNGIDIKVKTFSLGADDFIEKPFHFEELLARLGAVIRRSKGHAQSVLQIGGIAVNLDAKTVSIDGTPIHLTCKEYGILELLALRKGATLTKEAILDHLYGGLDEPELKIIDVFVCKVRKKLGPCKPLIQTVWGRGYVLTDQPVVSQPIPTGAPEKGDNYLPWIAAAVLHRLAKGPTGIDTLVSGCNPARSKSAVVNAVGFLKQRGFLTSRRTSNGGHQGWSSATYIITTAGRDFLAERQPAAVAA